MFRSTSTSLILRGVLALIIGVVALAWPGATVLALVIMFAIYAFADSALQATRAFSSDKAGPVAGHLLLALVDIAVGVAAVAWPAPTAIVLVLIASVWAVAGGVYEIVSGFAGGLRAGIRALDILTGLLLLAFGGLIFARRRRRTDLCPAVRPLRPDLRDDADHARRGGAQPSAGRPNCGSPARRPACPRRLTRHHLNASREEQRHVQVNIRR